MACGRLRLGLRPGASLAEDVSLVCQLVYRLAYNGDIAAGQLAVFQGASEAPISERGARDVLRTHRLRQIFWLDSLKHCEV